MRLAATTSNRIVFILALAGAAVSLYLTLAHMNYLSLSCGEIAGCADVAAHPSARGFGIPGLEAVPTAVFGFGMFITMAALSFWRVVASGQRQTLIAARIQSVVAGLALLVAAYLTYLEAYVIRAWCQWCILTAVIIVLMTLALSLARRDPTETLSI